MTSTVEDVLKDLSISATSRPEKTEPEARRRGRVAACQRDDNKILVIRQSRLIINATDAKIAAETAWFD